MASIFDNPFAKTVKKRGKVLARASRRKYSHYVPLYGDRTLAGTKLTKNQQSQQAKARGKGLKKTKKQFKKVWRKLI